MPHQYDKPALSIEQQIELLQSRGLSIPDKNKASHYLQFINYYLLSGYTISFEKIVNGKRDHQFQHNTTFDDLIHLYDFDRHLRILVMDAIERIEVAIRAQICLKMALTYQDSHWYLNPDLFRPEFRYESFLSKCRDEQKRSKERFVLHYKNTYDKPELIPAWMLTELLPMGTWSQIYENLTNRHDRKQISDVFKLSPIELESWLHCLTYIRNLCAHHARLWNRHFTLRPKPVKEYLRYLTPNTTFAAQAAMIHVILKIISPESKWVNKLWQLMQNHPFINPSRMGFSESWQEDKFWEI